LCQLQSRLLSHWSLRVRCHLLSHPYLAQGNARSISLPASCNTPVISLLSRLSSQRWRWTSSQTLLEAPRELACTLSRFRPPRPQSPGNFQAFLWPGRLSMLLTWLLVIFRCRLSRAHVPRRSWRWACRLPPISSH